MVLSSCFMNRFYSSLFVEATSRLSAVPPLTSYLSLAALGKAVVEPPSEPDKPLLVVVVGWVDIFSWFFKIMSLFAL